MNFANGPHVVLVLILDIYVYVMLFILKGVFFVKYVRLLCLLNTNLINLMT